MNRDQFSLMTFTLAKELDQGIMSVEDILRLAAEAGVPAIDVMCIRESDILTYLEAVKITGIRICCYISVISFLAKEDNIRRNLERELKIASKLGAKLFMIVPFRDFQDIKKARSEGRAYIRRMIADGFRLAVEMSRQYGLTVCFETTPHDALCLSGIEDCKWMLNQVPGLGLVFDTANMLSHGDKTLEAYEALKNYIVHVHLKDVSLKEGADRSAFCEITADGYSMECTLWGEGVIPVKEVWCRMMQSGYSGMFAIEYAHPIEAMTMTEHLDRLKRHLAALEF